MSKHDELIITTLRYLVDCTLMADAPRGDPKAEVARGKLYEAGLSLSETLRRAYYAAVAERTAQPPAYGMTEEPA